MKTKSFLEWIWFKNFWGMPMSISIFYVKVYHVGLSYRFRDIGCFRVILIPFLENSVPNSQDWIFSPEIPKTYYVLLISLHVHWEFQLVFPRTQSLEHGRVHSFDSPKFTSICDKFESYKLLLLLCVRFKRCTTDTLKRI